LAAGPIASAREQLLRPVQDLKSQLVLQLLVQPQHLAAALRALLLAWGAQWGQT
jgi:hypothetical protein